MHLAEHWLVCYSVHVQFQVNTSPLGFDVQVLLTKCLSVGAAVGAAPVAAVWARSCTTKGTVQLQSIEVIVVKQFMRRWFFNAVQHELSENNTQQSTHAHTRDEKAVALRWRAAPSSSLLAQQAKHLL